MKKELYYLTPKKYREFFKAQIMYAGIKDTSANRIVGYSFFLSIVMFLNSLVGFWLIGYGVMSIPMGMVIGFAVIMAAYLFFMLVADSRANQIETVLPDALQLISANVRAGMTIDRAIWLSARPEFGVLEEEIKMVGAKTMEESP